MNGRSPQSNGWRMTPTADQVAHAVVAASRFYKVDPIEVLRHAFIAKHKRSAMGRGRALVYAVLAIGDVFGNDVQACRLLGLTSTRAGSFRWQIGKGALHWWNPKVLDLVKAAIPDAPAAPPVRSAPAGAPTLPPDPETAPLPALRKPAGLPAKRMAPNFGTVGGMGPPRPYSPARDLVGEKQSLRNALAEAVRNTAKMPSQN